MKEVERFIISECNQLAEAFRNGDLDPFECDRPTIAWMLDSLLQGADVFGDVYDMNVLAWEMLEVIAMHGLDCNLSDYLESIQ